MSGSATWQSAEAPGARPTKSSSRWFAVWIASTRARSRRRASGVGSLSGPGSGLCVYRSFQPFESCAAPRDDARRLGGVRAAGVGMATPSSCSHLAASNGPRSPRSRACTLRTAIRSSNAPSTRARPLSSPLPTSSTATVRAHGVFHATVSLRFEQTLEACEGGLVKCSHREQTDAIPVSLDFPPQSRSCRE